jgi:hypothetical protein
METMEKDNSAEEVVNPAETTDSTRQTKTGIIASFLGRLDSAGESGLKKLLLNMPFVLFLFLLATLHIANNHLAENYARGITKTEKEVKQLRWQYMTTTSGLMKMSKQSEVAKLVSAQGIKELRIPPYKIETKKD